MPDKTHFTGQSEQVHCFIKAQKRCHSGLHYFWSKRLRDVLKALSSVFQACLGWINCHCISKKSKPKVQSLICAFLHWSFCIARAEKKKVLGKVEQHRDEERALLWGRDTVSFTILILWNASAPLTYLFKINTQLDAHWQTPKVTMRIYL